MNDQEPAPPVVVTPAFQDDELVYVDPENNSVVGRVEFGKNGIAKKMEVAEEPEPVAGEEVATGKFAKPRRRMMKSFYPWGTYRSMKKIYKIEGKQPKSEPSGTLDEVLVKALEQPFW